MPFLLFCSLPGGGENRCCYHRFPQAAAGADHVDPPGAERGAHRGVRGHGGRQSRRPEGTRGTNLGEKPSCQGFADPRCRFFSSWGGVTKVYLGEIAVFLGAGNAWRLAAPVCGSFSLPNLTETLSFLPTAHPGRLRAEPPPRCSRPAPHGAAALVPGRGGGGGAEHSPGETFRPVGPSPPATFLGACRVTSRFKDSPAGTREGHEAAKGFLSPGKEPNRAEHRLLCDDSFGLAWTKSQGGVRVRPAALGAARGRWCRAGCVVGGLCGVKRVHGIKPTHSSSPLLVHLVFLTLNCSSKRLMEQPWALWQRAGVRVTRGHPNLVWTSPELSGFPFPSVADPSQLNYLRNKCSRARSGSRTQELSFPRTRQVRI